MQLKITIYLIILKVAWQRGQYEPRKWLLQLYQQVALWKYLFFLIVKAWLLLSAALVDIMFTW